MIKLNQETYRRLLGEMGSNIRAARLSKGWIQSDLALKFGCSRQYLSQLERGKKGISVAKLAILAKLLEIDAKEFFSRNSLIDSQENQPT